MFEILMKVNNVLNELTSDYLAIEDEDINDVIENASLVCNSQLKCFDFYIVKNKPLSTQRWKPKWKPTELFKPKPGTSSKKLLSSPSSLLILIWEQFSSTYVSTVIYVLPYDLLLCVVYEYRWGRDNFSYYCETEGHLKVRSREDIETPPLTFEKQNRLKRIQYVNTFYNVIITLLLTSLPS